MERCQYEGVDFSPQGVIWGNIPSLGEFSAVTKQSPFPVGAVGKFLQGCQAALTAPKCSPGCGGLIESGAKAFSLEAEYFPVQCRKSPVLFSQKPLPSPAWPCCKLSLCGFRLSLVVWMQASEKCCSSSFCLSSGILLLLWL